MSKSNFNAVGNIRWMGPRGSPGSPCPLDMISSPIRLAGPVGYANYPVRTPNIVNFQRSCQPMWHDEFRT